MVLVVLFVFGGMAGPVSATGPEQIPAECLTDSGPDDSSGAWDEAIQCVLDNGDVLECQQDESDDSGVLECVLGEGDPEMCPASGVNSVDEGCEKAACVAEGGNDVYTCMGVYWDPCGNPGDCEVPDPCDNPAGCEVPDPCEDPDACTLPDGGVLTATAASLACTVIGLGGPPAPIQCPFAVWTIEHATPDCSVDQNAGTQTFALDATSAVYLETTHTAISELQWVTYAHAYVQGDGTGEDKQDSQVQFVTVHGPGQYGDVTASASYTTDLDQVYPDAGTPAKASWDNQVQAIAVTGPVLPGTTAYDAWAGNQVFKCARDGTVTSTPKTGM